MAVDIVTVLFILDCNAVGIPEITPVVVSIVRPLGKLGQVIDLSVSPYKFMIFGVRLKETFKGIV